MFSPNPNYPIVQIQPIVRRRRRPQRDHLAPLTRPYSIPPQGRRGSRGAHANDTIIGRYRDSAIPPVEQQRHAPRPAPQTPAIGTQGDDDIQIRLDDGPLAPDDVRPARETRTRRTGGPPNAVKVTLYDKWNRCLPSLQAAYLLARAGRTATALAWTCECVRRAHRVTCVFWDRFEIQTFYACEHRPLPERLVDAGLFPSGPVKPGYAYDCKMLDLLVSLTRHACDSAQALASALHAHHRNWGYIMRGKYNQPIQEGYRRTLQYALQWYEVMQHNIALEVQRRTLSSAPAATLASEPTTPRHVRFVTPPTSGAAHHDNAHEPSARDMDLGETPVTKIWMDAARNAGLRVGGVTAMSPYLLHRCPACFALASTGRSFDVGGDVHVAADGNFMHRHFAHAGQCPPIAFDSRAMVPKAFVDAVGKALEAAGKRPPRPYASRVPERVLKQCAKSHVAADGSTVKTAGEGFDDTGLMAMVCRHDIPLYLCNIDTPGEQQKYMIALEIWILLQMPDDTTVTSFYDINCVTWRMLMAYGVLPDWMLRRLQSVTSVLHAYGHQWECQLVFNARLVPGAGLTDGEGTERFWSQMSGLIGMLRHVSKARRPIILELQADFLASVSRNNLGHWMQRKWEAIETRRHEARVEIVRIGFTAEYLREQWEAQIEAQLSLRHHTAPALRNDLQAIMELQAQIDTLEACIAAAETSLRDTSRATVQTPHTASQRRNAIRQHVAALRVTHRTLSDEAAALYASLDIGDRFPSITRYGMAFVKALAMAYDAKRKARAKITGRIQEYSRLDQAVGGAGTPLGTTQHQRTVRSIRKRTPALLQAIAKYNDLCDQLHDLLPEGLDFPLPERLPTEIAALRDDPSLLEDVWLAGVPGDNAPWLQDARVRRGIRAQLVLDRCDEEERRLVREEAQFLQWLHDACTNTNAALDDEDNALYRPWLKLALADLDYTAHRCKGLHNGERLWLDAVRRRPASASPATPPPSSPTARAADAVTHEAVPEVPDLDESLLDPDDDADDVADYRARGHIVEAVREIEDAGSDVGDDVADNVVEDVADGVGTASALASPHVTFLQPRELDAAKRDFELSNAISGAHSQLIPVRRRRPPQGAFARLDVHGFELDALRGSGDLTDETMYSGAAVLSDAFPGRLRKIAILPPAVIPAWEEARPLPRIRHLLRYTMYDGKDIAIVPIRRDTLWRVAVAYRASRRIEVCDPGRDDGLWRHDATSAAALLDGVSADGGASASPWAASRLGIPAAEASDADSGVWVLACIAAVLRSKRHTGLGEGDIACFRAYLYIGMCTIPRMAA